MKLKFLGTAAAEGIPALFCDCRVCRHAHQIRGKEIKTRSQAIVDEKILIDFPPDTYMHILYGGLDLKNVHTLLVTHSHPDHLYERDFWCRLNGMANDIEEVPLHIYLADSAYELAKAFTDNNMKGSGRIVLHRIEPFVSFEAEGYKVTPLAADHDEKSTPVIYIIEKDGRRMLYAHDTGVFPDKTWEYLARYDNPFNLVSIDCTAMLLEGWHRHHLGLDSDAEVIDRLRSMGLLDEESRIFVNHFSHNGKATHEELVKAAEKYGFDVSHDGLEVEF